MNDAAAVTLARKMIAEKASKRSIIKALKRNNATYHTIGIVARVLGWITTSNRF